MISFRILSVIVGNTGLIAAYGSNLSHSAERNHDNFPVWIKILNSGCDNQKTIFPVFIDFVSYTIINNLPGKTSGTPGG